MWLARRFRHVVRSRLLAALAGDDQHGLEPAGVGLEQEGAQPRMGIALAQPVQIDARFDLDLAGGDLPDLAAVEVGKWRGRASMDAADRRRSRGVGSWRGRL